MWYEYLGWLQDCWEFFAQQTDYYRIQKKNPSAFAMKTKVAQKVGKNWIYLTNNNEVIEDEEALSKVLKAFSNSSFFSFKDDYFTQYFASGDIYLGAKKYMDWTTKIVTVDSRTIEKIIDKGEIVWYKQKVWTNNSYQERKYTIKELYNHIVRRDPDKPNYWMSIYTPIVYDALSSMEISKRNFYFFKNNARPDLVIMFENISWVSQEEYAQALKDFEKKYQWTVNSHKTIASNSIKDIKVLEVNHKDLQLLELDKVSIKKIGMMFGIDPRLLWFSDDVWAYATMKEIGKHSLEALNVYQNDLEQDMNNSYRLFVDPSFKYTIKLDWETFDDRSYIEESQRKDVNMWILTIEEVRIERWLPVDNLPDRTKQPVIPTSFGTEPSPSI